MATDPLFRTLHVGRSLYFINARFLEALIRDRVAEDQGIRSVVLMVSAVNAVEYAALETIVTINETLRDLGTDLH